MNQKQNTQIGKPTFCNVYENQIHIVWKRHSRKFFKKHNDSRNNHWCLKNALHPLSAHRSTLPNTHTHCWHRNDTEQNDLERETQAQPQKSQLEKASCNGLTLRCANLSKIEWENCLHTLIGLTHCLELLDGHFSVNVESFWEIVERRICNLVSHHANIHTNGFDTGPVCDKQNHEEIIAKSRFNNRGSWHGPKTDMSSASTSELISVDTM